METGVDTMTLTVFAGMLAGFFGIAKVMLNQASKDREADREERKALTEAVSKMAENSGRQAEATERQAREAEKRNGHLAEITVQQADRIMQGIEHISRQSVDHQVVKHQEVQE
jgi:hypothetical protein